MKKRYFKLILLFIIIVTLASGLASCAVSDANKATEGSQRITEKVTEKATETQDASLNNDNQSNSSTSNSETTSNDEAANGTESGNNTEVGTGTETNNNGNNESVDGELIVFKNNTYTAEVIRSDAPSAFDKAMYDNLREILKKKTSRIPSPTTDYVASGTEQYNGPAILVGSTNYKETKELYDTLEGTQARAALIGNKYVLAWNDEAMGKALLEEIDKKLQELSTTDTIIITSEWNITLTEKPKENTGFDESGLATNIQLPDISTTGLSWNVSGRDSGQGSKIYIANNASITHFTAYVEALTNAGFTRYTTNKLETNEFATFITKEQIVHVMLFEPMNVIKVTVDPRINDSDPSMRFALPGLASENNYTKTSTATEFVQLGMKQVSGSTENGMGYLVKLTDGRFVIVDAGYSWSAGGGANSAKFLIDTMKKMQGNDSKPVIAAWIVTHIHTDHAGGFMGMANSYVNDVIIEKFIYNQPCDDQMNAVSNMSARKTWITDAIKKLTEAGSLQSVVKAHPGMQFFFCDLTITVMGTIDLIEDSDYTKIGNGNDSSVVTMFDISGVKFLLTGDAEPQETIIIRDIYGGIANTTSVLKADFIQVAHHGYYNTNTDYIGHKQNALNVMASGGATEVGSSPIYAFVPIGLERGKDPAGYYDGVVNTYVMKIFASDHRIVAYNKNCTIAVTPDGKYTMGATPHDDGFLIGTWSTY